LRKRFVRVLTVTGHYLPGYKGGGPIKTIKNLFDRVGKEIAFKLITSDRDLGSDIPYLDVKHDTWNTVGNAKVFYSQAGLVGFKQIARIIREKDYDVLYLNSFFSLRFSILPLLIAKLLRQKVIIGVRGEFSDGALSIKPFKKRIYINLFKTFQLYRGIVFQASSEYEAADIQKILGYRSNVFIAENIGSQEFTNNMVQRTLGPLNAVFVSRISPMKNLLVALEILKDVKQPLTYHIYGPIEDQSYWKRCEEVINTLPHHIKAEYKGVLKPADVVKTMANYNLFFMPTKGENYGHVITEALCAGLPLLIADTTPWRNLQAQSIGWDLPLNEPGRFSEILDQLAVIPAGEYLIMREIVLAWAKDKFSQSDAVEANLNMFRYAYEKGIKSDV
jgi:glycosyltransferase involved in cell wall biosynthesis